MPESMKRNLRVAVRRRSFQANKHALTIKERNGEPVKRSVQRNAGRIGKLRYWKVGTSNVLARTQVTSSMLKTTFRMAVNANHQGLAHVWWVIRSKLIRFRRSKLIRFSVTKWLRFSVSTKIQLSHDMKVTATSHTETCVKTLGSMTYLETAKRRTSHIVDPSYCRLNISLIVTTVHFNSNFQEPNIL
jgi:hypothetical protein